MIPIQVLGTGLIPRGYGLAPRKEPFKADKTLIWTIMQSPGLTVNFINPETGAPTQLTRQNLDRIYKKWANYRPTKPAPQTTQTHPAAPVKPANEEPVAAVHAAEEVQGLDMSSLIGAPLQPSPEARFEEMKGELKGDFVVPPGDLNDPNTIDPSQLPEDVVIGLPADPNDPVDGEAALITVTNGESREDALPEEPVESVGYHTPGPAESESSDGDKDESDPEEESPTDGKAVFKPILNDDEDTDKPNPGNKGNNQNGRHKHQHRH